LRWLRKPLPYDDQFLRKGQSWEECTRTQNCPDHWKMPGSKDKLLKLPFTTTIHVLNSCILKLSRTQRAQKVYRGTKGGRLPEEFWRLNEHGVRGGIDLGFMSTTLDRDVALNFARGSKQLSTVFEIQMGMVDRGADVQWLSQFPGEAEILFAPLVGLEVVGHPAVQGASSS
jgi:hypothetical protein